MNKNEMVIQLQNGKHPIDVSLQKWVDILNNPSSYERRARHPLDSGVDNCALCHTYKTCRSCIFYVCYGVHCDESGLYLGNKKYKKIYKKDFYAQYRETGDAQIVISAILKLKKKMWFVLLKFYIKRLFYRFICFLKRLIRKLFEKITKEVRYEPV